MKLMIDGGASSTKVYLISRDKKILEKNFFEGINPQTRELKTIEVLNKITLKYLSKKEHIEKIYLGAPGIEQCQNFQKIFSILSQIVEKNNINLCPDIYIQKEIFCKGSNFIIVSFGSGVIILKNWKDKDKIFSSFGYLFQDFGGAFNFSQEFIRQAIIDYENEFYDSNFIKYVLIYFKYNSMEEIKKIYSKLDDIKTNFLNFTKFILLEIDSDLKNELKIIFKTLCNNFFNYFDKINSKNKIKRIYILGGMLKNKFYKNLIEKNFIKRNYILENI